jgi:hypothetical protein
MGTIDSAGCCFQFPIYLFAPSSSLVRDLFVSRASIDGLDTNKSKRWYQEGRFVADRDFIYCAACLVFIYTMFLGLILSKDGL